MSKIWQKRFCTDAFRNKYLCLKSNEERAFLQKLLKKVFEIWWKKRAFLYRFCCKMYLYMYFNGRIFLNSYKKQMYSLNRMHICIDVVKKGIFYQNWIKEAFLHRFYRKSSYMYNFMKKNIFAQLGENPYFPKIRRKKRNIYTDSLKKLFWPNSDENVHFCTISSGESIFIWNIMKKVNLQKLLQ